MNKDGKFEEAMAVYKTAVNLAEQSGDQRYKYRIIAKIAGKLLVTSSDYLKARQYLEEVHEFASNTGEIFLLGYSTSLLSKLDIYDGNFEVAIEKLKTAYDLLLASRSDRQIEGVQWHLILAYSGLPDYEKVKVLIRPFIYRAAKNKAIEDLLCIPIAIVLGNTGHAIRAVEYIAFMQNLYSYKTGWVHHWFVITDLLHNLKVELGEQIYHEAYERGANRDPDDVIDELVAWIEEVTKDDLSSQ